MAEPVKSSHSFNYYASSRSSESSESGDLGGWEVITKSEVDRLADRAPLEPNRVSGRDTPTKLQRAGHVVQMVAKTSFAAGRYTLSKTPFYSLPADQKRDTLDETWTVERAEEFEEALVDVSSTHEQTRSSSFLSDTTEFLSSKDNVDSALEALRVNTREILNQKETLLEKKRGLEERRALYPGFTRFFAEKFSDEDQRQLDRIDSIERILSHINDYNLNTFDKTSFLLAELGKDFHLADLPVSEGTPPQVREENLGAKLEGALAKYQRAIGKKEYLVRDTARRTKEVTDPPTEFLLFGIAKHSKNLALNVIQSELLEVESKIQNQLSFEVQRELLNFANREVPRTALFFDLLVDARTGVQNEQMAIGERLRELSIEGNQAEKEGLYARGEELIDSSLRIVELCKNLPQELDARAYSRLYVYNQAIQAWNLEQDLQEFLSSYIESHGERLVEELFQRFELMGYSENKIRDYVSGSLLLETEVNERQAKEATSELEVSDQTEEMAPSALLNPIVFQAPEVLQNARENVTHELDLLNTEIAQLQDKKIELIEKKNLTFEETNELHRINFLENMYSIVEKLDLDSLQSVQDLNTSMSKILYHLPHIAGVLALYETVLARKEELEGNASKQIKQLARHEALFSLPEGADERTFLEGRLETSVAYVVALLGYPADFVRRVLTEEYRK